jgi:hypothetical protein
LTESHKNIPRAASHTRTVSVDIGWFLFRFPDQF